MEKFILKSLIILAALTTIACGKETDPQAGIDTYVYVSGNFSQQDSVALAGTGTVRFTSTLPSINSGRSLEIAGEIFNSGSLNATFFSDVASLPLNRGVRVNLTRTSNASLTGYISVNGSTVGIHDGRLNYITPGAFSLIIEVHNTPSLSRVIIWKKDSVTYSLANVEVDSATNAHLSGIYPLGVGGLGVYAGLQLTDARLTSAFLSEPKVD